MSTEREKGVYKYCDEHGLDILRNLEIKFTPPSQFNDPFEFMPHVINSNPLPTVNRGSKKEMYEEEKASGRFNGNFRQFLQLFPKNPLYDQQSMMEALAQSSDQIQRAYPDIAGSVVGVLCLSSHRDSIVMWAHYCDKHRGLVIGFDGNHDYFSPVAGLKLVNYIRERIAYDRSWKDGSKELDDFIQRIVFSKNDEWTYEDELRLMITLNRLKKKPLNDGKLGYFGSFPAIAIRTVTLGVKCTMPFEDSVREVLQDKKLAHVKLDRAVLHASKFALRFE